ncbi:MAG TPA: adenosylcobinamide-phosphate synthase CbiB [Anaerovoracaceae bacterium]|nr:adenosylcobinamide-phosphate synthase CbiB [Anaerovoracaceae bacterium]
MKLTLIIIGAYLIDLAIGDPRFLPHPVIFIGRLISYLEKLIRKMIKNERVGGIILVIGVLLITGILTHGLIILAYKIYMPLGVILESLLIYQIMATKSLREESMKVARALDDSLEDGRRAVSYIVGRDTKELDEKGVIKATVETVAENTTDGIVAPIIFCSIGGAGFGMIYKAVNTMDSMVGYKNEKYIKFGTAAAKLDDIVNYIPARITAIIMIIASGLLKMDMKNAIKVFKRDRYNHKSPNSAQTESVCAGALDLQLAGNSCYFGEVYEKPTIGDEIRKIEIEDIKRVNRLMYATSLIAIAICIGIRLLIFKGM